MKEHCLILKNSIPSLFKSNKNKSEWAPGKRKRKTVRPDYQINKEIKTLKSSNGLQKKRDNLSKNVIREHEEKYTI